MGLPPAGRATVRKRPAIPNPLPPSLRKPPLGKELPGQLYLFPISTLLAPPNQLNINRPPPLTPQIARLYQNLARAAKLAHRQKMPSTHILNTGAQLSYAQTRTYETITISWTEDPPNNLELQRIITGFWGRAAQVEIYRDGPTDPTGPHHIQIRRRKIP